MTAPRWTGWGASAIGPAHRREGVSNQDAWTIRATAKGIVAAVSDGLGSCAHAEIGARAACCAVLAAADLHGRGVRGEVADLPARVQGRWLSMLAGHAPADCSATCLFVAIRPSAEALVAQLGDGMIAACTVDGTIDLLLPDKSDSFANLTHSLADSNAAARWRTMMVPEDRYAAFVLCSDGIADDLEPSMVRSFVQAVVAHYRGYSRRAWRREVRRWLGAWPVSGHTDDKTIACIYRSEGA